MTEGAVTTEAGSFFQYFTTLTSPPAVARTFEYLVVVLSKAATREREKKYKLESTSKRPVNILNVVIRLACILQGIQFQAIAAISLTRGGDECQ